jgi:hypothetical protein
VPNTSYNYIVYGYNSGGPTLTQIAASGSQVVINPLVSSINVSLVFVADVDVTIYTHIVVIICGTCNSGGGTQLATSYYESLAIFAFTHDV